MENRTLLIEEDEPDVIANPDKQLRHDRYTIYSANSGEKGFRLLNEKTVGKGI
jgi:CheY-like chemotaxis protein